MSSFNLVERPWLPCMTSDGRGGELSLRQALLDAHELRELFDPSPLVTVALHRLLLAVLHRAYAGPPHLKAWQAMREKGRFDPKTIDAYLTDYHHRFDIFDRDWPFYQVQFMPDLADPKKQAPIAKLAQEAAAGNNATLFDHRIDGAPAPIAAAEAARCLVAVQGFSIGFGKSFPFYLSDSTLIRGYSVLAAGATLYETLLLNLMAYSRDDWSEEGDAACWERAAQREPVKEGTPPDGLCDLLTWPSRQVHLIPDGDGETVSWCQLRQGLKLVTNRLDPYKCYLRDEQRGWRPRSFRPERALWRDSTMLLAQVQERNNRTVHRPELMNWLARIGAQSEVGRAVYRLRAYGLTTDDGNAASVVLWRREELPLPLALLSSREAIDALQEALDAAEDVGRALQRSARYLAELLLAPASDEPDGRKPDPEKGVKPLARALGIEQRYWPRLEEPFAALLTGLAAAAPSEPDEPSERRDGADALRDWAKAVRDVATAALDETADGLDRSARSLKAVAAVQGRFRGSLNKALAPLEESEKGEEGEAA
jgi:CRISPR system Cascade subunit CasA